MKTIQELYNEIMANLTRWLPRRWMNTIRRCPMPSASGLWNIPPPRMRRCRRYRDGKNIFTMRKKLE